jgi:shikimate kinase
VTSADHLVLVGSMGVGKTTVGRILATRLGRPLRDSDLDLQASGRSGRDIARAAGVNALHRWEADHLLDVLATPAAAIIAAAASVVDDARCFGALQAPFVAWLWAPPDLLVARMAAGNHRRDLGDDHRVALAALAERRDPLYRKVADTTVDVGSLTPDQAADAIVRRLRSRPG